MTRPTHLDGAPWDVLGCTREDFQATTWDQRPHHTTAAALPPIPFATVPELLDFLEGVDLDPAFVDVKGLFGYLDRAAFTREGRVDLDKVRVLVLEQGHALVIRAAHTTMDPVRRLAERYARDTGTLVRSNLYVTTQGTRAYPLHWDTHGLLAMQVVGSKRWKLYAPVHPQPLPGHTYRAVQAPIDADAPERVVELCAGDAMYLPRGWGHEVVTTAPFSVHVTFGFHALTVHDLLQIATTEALAALEADADLRAYATGPVDAEALAARVGAAVAASLARQTPTPTEGVGEIVLVQPHLYLIREPVHDRVRVYVGQPRQDVKRHIDLPLRAEPLLACLLREGAVSRGRAEAMVSDVGPILELLEAEGLVRSSR